MPYTVVDPDGIAVIRTGKVPAVVELVFYLGHLFGISIWKAILFFIKLDISILLCCIYVPWFI